MKLAPGSDFAVYCVPDTPPVDELCPSPLKPVEQLPVMPSPLKADAVQFSTTMALLGGDWLGSDQVNVVVICPEQLAVLPGS